MKKKYLIWIILILGGILTAQMIGYGFFSTYGYMNEYYLSGFANARFDNIDLFWNILWERGKLFLMLFVLLLSPVRKIVPVIISGVAFYSLGFVGAISCMNVGAGGILLLMAALLPHGVFYILVAIAMVQSEHRISYDRKREIGIRGIRVAIYMIIIISGCLLEAAVSTRILQFILIKLGY